MEPIKHYGKLICIIVLLLLAGQSASAQTHTVTCYSYYIDSLQRHSDTVIVQTATYDKKERLIKKTVINSNDTVPIYFVEYYNKKGKRSRKDIYTADSSFVQTTLFERDKHGEIAVQKSTQKKDHYKLVHTNHYTKGHISSSLIEMKIGDSVVKDMGSEIIFRYDERGNQISMTNFLNGTFLSETLKKYDDADNLIEEQVHDRTHAEKSKSAFTYDKQNRKETQQVYENGVLVSSLHFFWNKDFNQKIEIHYPRQSIHEIRYFVSDRH